MWHYWLAWGRSMPMYLVVEMLELAIYIQVSRQDLISNIEVRPKGNGHLPFLNPSVYKNIKVNTRFLQVNEIMIDRRPIID
jgi:hypothetical protein